MKTVSKNVQVLVDVSKSIRLSLPGIPERWLYAGEALNSAFAAGPFVLTSSDKRKPLQVLNQHEIKCFLHASLQTFTFNLNKH